MKKIAIIGTGNVGAHVANAAVNKNLPVELILIDQNQQFEKGQELDLRDTLLFSPNTKIQSGTLKDAIMKEVDIFVITAGAAQKPGETRIDLLGRNVKILKSIQKDLGTLHKGAIVLIVMNPLDILTSLAARIFELPAGQVFGSGTLLDTSRLRWRLSDRFERNIANIHGYVLGEHGDSEFVAWSTVDDAEKISQKERDDLEEQVRTAAYKIIEGKGATYFGIGSATVEILSSILFDSERVFPVSVPLNGEYGIKGISLGVPAKIGAGGIESVIEKELLLEEQEKLRQSAQKLKTILDQLG